MDTYQMGLEILRESGLILDRLRGYVSCAPMIQKVRTRCSCAYPMGIGLTRWGLWQAIAVASPEAENAAWQAVLPLVDTLRECYEYSAKLGTAAWWWYCSCC